MSNLQEKMCNFIRNLFYDIICMIFYNFINSYLYMKYKMYDHIELKHEEFLYLFKVSIFIDRFCSSFVLLNKKDWKMYILLFR